MTPRSWLCFRAAAGQSYEQGGRAILGGPEACFSSRSSSSSTDLRMAKTLPGVAGLGGCAAACARCRASPT